MSLTDARRFRGNMSRNYFKKSSQSGLAVFGTNAAIHGEPLSSIGEIATPRIADLLAQSLGIKADALPSAPGTPWQLELQRARKDTGWITTSNYREFFRQAGFDGDVRISFLKQRLVMVRPFDYL